jgi:GNAT superfamily N-acetyltransferase
VIEQALPLVRPVPQEANKIAALVARAMLDDPLNDYYFLKAGQREELGETLFRLLVTYGIRQGNLLATSSRYEGVAYWQTPSDIPWHGAEAILWGGIRLLAKAGLAVIQRMYRASIFGYRLRKRLVPGPHWYLGLLAVAQEHRGKGYASALLRPVLEIPRREGLPCYLETHKQVNVSIYEHFGFRVVERIEIPESGVLQWCMLKKGG